MLALAAALAFIGARRSLGLVLAYLAIAAGATIPARQLLDPPPNPASIRKFPDGSELTVEGTLVRETERMPDLTRLYVSLTRAGYEGRELKSAVGLIRVAVLDAEEFRLGDEVRLTSRLRFPRNDGNPGEFDYEDFMAREGIAATMTVRATIGGPPGIEVIGYQPHFPASQIEAIREHIGAFIDANLPWPERAEMRALVIGDRGGIDDRIRNEFARTGMAHLLVISGLHLSFLAAAAFAFVRLLMMLAPGLASRGYANKAAAIGAAIVVCAYASIAGHHVSTVRALVMVLAYMFAVVIDRAREALSSLALAAIVICIAIPGSTADIGFQLSFVSVIAIILGMQRFAGWYQRRDIERRLPGETRSRFSRSAISLLGYLAVSFWAMAGTAPLTAFHFNQFTIIGIVANAVVVPIMGFAATLSGLIAAAMSFVWMPAARVLLWFAGELLQLGNALAGWFVEWPLAWSRIFTPTFLELALAYSLLMIWLAAPIRAPLAPDPDRDALGQGPAGQGARGKRRVGWRLAFIIAIVAALALDAGWWSYDRFLSPDLRVMFLSVGEGDGAVIRFPGSAVMVIDAGGAYPGYDSGERIVAPFLWSRKIMHVNYIVMSHPDLDHFGGLEFIAENFAPRAFWTTGATSPDVAFPALLATIARERVPMKPVDATMPPIRVGGVAIKVLSPDSADTTGAAGVSGNNASSMVIRFDSPGASFLFTGDIEAPTERALVDKYDGTGLGATVLKVPHHGSATSSTAAFVAAVHPKIAVISDGYQNRFHFPSQAVLDRYRDSGATVLRTDQDGAVIAEVRGGALSIRTVSGPADIINSK
ncbi:MAG TPA: ComEC/Rec2 family competence protein [Candidatus Binataceae bacterium]